MPLLGGMQMSYVNGFAYRSVTPVSDDQIPERFQRAEEVFEKEAVARATPGVGRGSQTGCHQDPSCPAVGGSRCPPQSGTAGVRDEVPRSPRPDDLSAHALYRG